MFVGWESVVVYTHSCRSCRSWRGLYQESDYQRRRLHFVYVRIDHFVHNIVLIISFGICMTAKRRNMFASGCLCNVINNNIYVDLGIRPAWIYQNMLVAVAPYVSIQKHRALSLWRPIALVDVNVISTARTCGLNTTLVER